MKWLWGASGCAPSLGLMASAGLLSEGSDEGEFSTCSMALLSQRLLGKNCIMLFTSQECTLVCVYVSR